MSNLSVHLSAVPDRTAPQRPWLISIDDLAKLTSLSVRHLRRMDAARDIPGRLTIGRRVRFRCDIVYSWAIAGMPDRETWSALLKEEVQ